LVWALSLYFLGRTDGGQLFKKAWIQNVLS
jgi:hypothetical protein